MSAAGFRLFVSERSKLVGAGEEAPDWEEEWDDLTIREQSEYVAMAQRQANGRASEEGREEAGESKGEGGSSAALSGAKRPAGRTDKTAWKIPKKLKGRDVGGPSSRDSGESHAVSSSETAPKKPASGKGKVLFAPSPCAPRSPLRPRPFLCSLVCC